MIFMLAGYASEATRIGWTCPSFYIFGSCRPMQGDPALVVKAHLFARARFRRLCGALRTYPQPLKKPAIRLGLRIARGQQRVAIEDRVRASHKAQRLHRVIHLLTPRRKPHHRARHGDARHRYRTDELERIERLDFAERCAFDRYEMIDRHRFRIGIHVGELRDEPRTLTARLAHADDAAAAHVDPRVAHALERVEAVLITARGNDLPIELGRRV